MSAPLISPATSTTPNGYTATTWNSSTVIPPLEADESLEFNFDFSNADMEAMMMNATQDFWASFPGEVGVSASY
jgi:hypothetical protein